MSIVQAPARQVVATRTIAARSLLPVFAVSIFLSALLLFSLEPMFAKMALPLLGGAPAVWSVAMVFFQVMMLAGYLYAHLLSRWLPVRPGALLHLGNLLSAGFFLPVLTCPQVFGPRIAGKF